MPNLYTIGFTQLSLAEFIGLLRGASVDAVVDIWLRNTYQLARRATAPPPALPATRGLQHPLRTHPALRAERRTARSLSRRPRLGCVCPRLPRPAGRAPDSRSGPRHVRALPGALPALLRAHSRT